MKLLGLEVENMSVKNLLCDERLSSSWVKKVFNRITPFLAHFHGQT